MRFRLEAEPELRDQAAKRALGQTLGAGGEKLLPLGKRLKEDLQRLLLARCGRALGRQVRHKRDERVRESVDLQLEREGPASIRGRWRRVTSIALVRSGSPGFCATITAKYGRPTGLTPISIRSGLSASTSRVSGSPRASSARQRSSTVSVIEILVIGAAELR